MFSPAQIGVRDTQVEDDGKVTNLDQTYLSSSVDTPGLPNGGSHTILLGAFLTPLPKGTHTVTIRVSVNGALFGSFTFENVYTVIVE